MSRTLYGYILRELAESFAIAFAAYSFVMLLAVVFQPLQAGLGITFVMKVVPFGLMSTLPYTVPIGMLTACVIAYGRLSSDNETLAMTALGVHPLAAMAPAVTFAVLLTLPMLYCNHFLEPASHQMRKIVLKEAAIMQPFKFLKMEDPVMEIGDIRIFITEAAGSRLSDVIIFRQQDVCKEEADGTKKIERKTEVTYAKTATYEVRGHGVNREMHLTLRDGRFLYLNSAERFDFHPISFDETWQSIPLAGQSFTPGWKDLSTPQLLKEAGRFEGPGAEPIDPRRLNELRTRIRKRWSSAFESLSLMLLGVPLGIMTRRGRKLVGFGVSVPVVIVFYALSGTGEALSTNGVFPAALWPWANVLLVAGSGLFLSYRLFKV